MVECGPSLPGDLHLTFGADHLAVRRALREVLQGLEPVCLTSEQRDALELILAEVLNNVVEHAYAEAVGLIDLRISSLDRALWCEISDRGTMMPRGALPAGASARVDVPVLDLPEGGFGWFLIRTLTRDLHYRRDGDTNRLSFSLDLSQASPAV